MQTGWRQEAVRNPFSQQTVLPNRATYISSEVATANSVPPPHISAAHISSLRQSASIPPYSHQTPASDVVMKNSPLTVTPFHNLHSASLPSMRVESTSSVKPSLISNAEERQRFPIPSNTLLPTTARPQIHPQQQQLLSGPSDPYTPVYSKQIGKPNPASESWRTTQGLPSFYRPLNQNNYNASLVGPEQPQLMSGPKWEGNEYVEEDDFESWSPDNSPVRNPEYMMGRSFPDARTNPGREYRPERMRQRNSSGYRDQNRYGNRRWRDRRR